MMVVRLMVDVGSDYRYMASQVHSAAEPRSAHYLRNGCGTALDTDSGLIVGTGYLRSNHYHEVYLAGLSGANIFSHFGNRQARLMKKDCALWLVAIGCLTGWPIVIRTPIFP